MMNYLLFAVIKLLLLEQFKDGLNGFREGREEVEDEARPERPITETTAENIEQVRLLIDHDPHITIAEVQEQTDLSYRTVQRIISDHLKLRKLIARYVPKLLNDFQRSERVRICKENLAKFQKETWRFCDVITGDESWFYHQQIGRKSSNAAWMSRGDPPPVVIRRSKFAPRTLFSIFLKSNGSVLIHHMGRGQTMDHHYYINNCLRPLVDEINCQRPSSGTRDIINHHDNEKPHVHKNVTNYLESEGIRIMPHPLNSPDLAPCEFWLFDLIKENLDDHNDSESLRGAVTKFMYSLSKEEYKKTFDKWLQRMQLCIDNKGDYFEHLIK
ncbi:unnamed protein product [Rotaria sp. Silwood2]|nr:unnamed protein product [Rotaria sp. Silwood2]CAF2962391.1 unnamed protein product [Rotaria sp. Silwood2]CAF3236360.1 unnamed protein product [Rotaria sp. Silwood2]CAF3365306.1 unnamed protein product [Rotaria sp. Silwood2]CAF4340721.1 unnamed protein product [Rotaria sp. Silwood2]